MGLESTVSYISDLTAVWPLGADDKTTIDDHLRYIKKAVKQTFPGISGAVTASASDILLISGLSANDLLRMSGDGVTATSYIGAVSFYCIEDDNNSVFSLYSASSGSWHTVGPPSTSVSWDWTALNNVPADAKWLEVRIDSEVAGLSTPRVKIYTRKDGSSDAADDRTLSFYFEALATPLDGFTRNGASSTFSVPVSNRKFNLLFTTTEASGFLQGNMRLIGWWK
jgi:hypothetical protein